MRVHVRVCGVHARVWRAACVCVVGMRVRVRVWRAHAYVACVCVRVRMRVCVHVVCVFVRMRVRVRVCLAYACVFGVCVWRARVRMRVWNACVCACVYACIWCAYPCGCVRGDSDSACGKPRTDLSASAEASCVSTRPPVDDLPMIVGSPVRFARPQRSHALMRMHTRPLKRLCYPMQYRHLS